ncbi:hypothetical protein ABK040_001195 [Willaertia magna]
MNRNVLLMVTLLLSLLQCFVLGIDISPVNNKNFENAGLPREDKTVLTARVNSALQNWNDLIKKKESLSSAFTYCYTNKRSWATLRTTNSDFTKIVISYNNVTQKYNIIERSLISFEYNFATDDYYTNKWTEKINENNIGSHSDGYPLYYFDGIFTACLNTFQNNQQGLGMDILYVNNVTTEPFLQKCGKFHTVYNEDQSEVGSTAFVLHDFRWNDTCILPNASSATSFNYQFLLLVVSLFYFLCILIH